MDTAQVAPRTSEGSDAEPQQQAQHQQEQQQQQAGQQQQQQATQQQPVQANDHAEQNAGAQQEANPQVEQSEPGTIVQFDLDEGSQEERQGLHFRAIRPIFGGKEGGVKHCEFKTVSADLGDLCRR